MFSEHQGPSLNHFLLYAHSATTELRLLFSIVLFFFFKLSPCAIWRHERSFLCMFLAQSVCGPQQAAALDPLAGLQ